MLIAREGFREVAAATVVLGGLSAGLGFVAWPLAIPVLAVWLWVLTFFRDPARRATFGPGELCSPADGTITEVSELAEHPSIGGPAIRIGMFLSLFNVHVNRSPCTGTVRLLSYRPGEYLDARHPESGSRNESNAIVIDPEAPMPGPVEVRQIAGLLARRIICHAKAGQRLESGERFGLIKFGSRSELIIPCLPGTEVAVSVGDKVRAGLTVLARQPISDETTPPSSSDQQEPAAATGSGSR